MMRLIALGLMVGFFGASASAEAKPCFVKRGKVCKSGNLSKDGPTRCLLSKTDGDLMYFLTKNDCAANRNGAGAIGSDSEARIREMEGKNACYYLSGEGKAEKCTKGYTESDSRGICHAGDTLLSDFYVDALCKKNAKSDVCWTYLPIKEGEDVKCDATPGRVVDAEGKPTSVSGYCKVGNREKTVEYYFDSVCEKPAFLAAKAGGFVGDPTAFQPIKVLPGTTDCERNGKVFDPSTGQCVVVEGAFGAVGAGAGSDMAK